MGHFPRGNVLHLCSYSGDYQSNRILYVVSIVLHDSLDKLMVISCTCKLCRERRCHHYTTQYDRHTAWESKINRILTASRSVQCKRKLFIIGQFLFLFIQQPTGMLKMGCFKWSTALELPTFGWSDFYWNLSPIDWISMCYVWPANKFTKQIQLIVLWI